MAARALGDCRDGGCWLLHTRRFSAPVLGRPAYGRSDGRGHGLRVVLGAKQSVVPQKRVLAIGAWHPSLGLSPTSGNDMGRLIVSPTVTEFRTGVEDRKSTRLNSSHSQISYAVFCLKKKNIRRPHTS